MLATIVNIQPKDAGTGGGETRETIVYRLADDMLDKLPDDYIPFEVGAIVGLYACLCLFVLLLAMSLAVHICFICNFVRVV